jgi:hypothetical protein
MLGWPVESSRDDRPPFGADSVCTTDKNVFFQHLTNHRSHGHGAARFGLVYPGPLQQQEG